MEPRAATPARRLEALRQLTEAGIPTSVMVAPVIPALNDSEIERILDAAAAVGVKEAGYVLLRLPLEVRDLFREWLMRELSRPLPARLQARARDARRQGLRFELGQAQTGTGPDCLDDRPALRGRLREARLQQGPHQAHDRGVQSAAPGARATHVVLISAVGMTTLSPRHGGLNNKPGA